MCEHLGISAITGKRVKGDDDNAIKEHFYSTITHLILKISQFSTNNNDFKVMFMKSLLTYGYHAALNKNKQYLPLELFDS